MLGAVLKESITMVVSIATELDSSIEHGTVRHKILALSVGAMEMVFSEFPLVSECRRTFCGMFIQDNRSVKETAKEVAFVHGPSSNDRSVPARPVAVVWDLCSEEINRT